MAPHWIANKSHGFAAARGIGRPAGLGSARPAGPAAGFCMDFYRFSWIHLHFACNLLEFSLILHWIFMDFQDFQCPRAARALSGSGSGRCRAAARRGAPPPPFDHFFLKGAAKFRFLGTASRARKVALAETRKRRWTHLVQNYSTAFALLQKTPNGGPVGGNKCARGAIMLDFSVKSPAKWLRC